MLESFFYTEEAVISTQDCLISIGVAILLGVAISAVYKITTGKQTEYLYDDRALERMVRERGVKGVQLFNKSKDKSISEEKMEEFFNNTCNIATTCPNCNIIGKWKFRNVACSCRSIWIY